MSRPITIAQVIPCCEDGTSCHTLVFADGYGFHMIPEREAALREWLNAEEERRQQEAALPKYEIVDSLSYVSVKRIGGLAPVQGVAFVHNNCSLYRDHADALEAAEAEKARLEARDRQRAGLPAVQP